MMDNNKAIRDAIKASGLRYWQVADRMGISENTFTRLLRHELNDADKARVLAVLENRKEVAE